MESTLDRRQLFDQLVLRLSSKVNLRPIPCSKLLDGAQGEDGYLACFDFVSHLKDDEGSEKDSRLKELNNAILKIKPETLKSKNDWVENYGTSAASWYVANFPNWVWTVGFTGHSLAGDDYPSSVNLRGTSFT